MKAIFIALSASLALIVASNVANAQYPQPGGSVSLTAPATAGITGAVIPLTCTLVDGAGTGVSNADCTFTIESQPGNDAAVGSIVITKKTNAQGVATTDLRTGSTAGTIIVSATAGTYRSVIVVNVGAAGTPPQAPVSPPSTGDGGLIK